MNTLYQIVRTKKGFTGKYVSPKVYDELEEITGYSRQTIQDAKYVAENTCSLRNEDLSFNHHRQVAPLEPTEQEFFLNKASEENLSQIKTFRILFSFILEISIDILNFANYFMLFKTKNIALTKDQVDKIGNTIIYLLEKMPRVNKTKILKTLFLIEESAIKKFGFPFFGIDFQLWKFGPVSKEVFIDLSDDSPLLFKDYISKGESKSISFKPIHGFNDDEFSNNDLAILDLIVDFVKDKSAKELVDITHSKNSLWRKSAVQCGILQSLESETSNSSENTIDFSLLFDNSKQEKEQFSEILEDLNFSNSIKK